MKRCPRFRLPSSLNFAVMGAVTLIGAIVDQLFLARRQRLRRAKGAFAPEPVESTRT